MTTTSRRLLCTILAAGLAASSLGLAQPPAEKLKAPAQPDKPKAPAAPDKPKSPAATPPPEAPAVPSAEEMQKMMDAYMKAMNPGEMHEHLAKGVGTWEGAVRLWQMPNMPPEESKCTTVITSMFDGRFFKGETKGDMMGEFEGFGIYGYDNTSQKFQSMWIDNMGTGMMNGTGELSADGKTLTWNFSFTDPMTGKPATMREVDRVTGDNTRALEMYGEGMDGKEIKMMEIAYTRKAEAGAEHAK